VFGLLGHTYGEYVVFFGKLGATSYENLDPKNKVHGKEYCSDYIR
jgi:hypothetical protein